MCKNCGCRILVTIFRGSDWCSEKCRKALQGDTHFNKEMS